MKIRRILFIALVGVLSLFIFTACKDKAGAENGKEQEEEQEDLMQRRKLEFWEVTDEMDFEEAYKLESRNFKLIKSLEPLYEEDSYKLYRDAISEMDNKKTRASVDEAIAVRKGLVQSSTVEDRVWLVWGDVIPLMDGESYTEEELDESMEDAYGSEPILIKYLLDNPAEAKGNIVMVSGGEFKLRGNKSEGYPAAKVFNELGYNCFLLQRRVAPYSQMDIFMDFQRSVRLVKYYAEKEGYGGTDMIAGVGWSGGGGTILGAINNFYGNLIPSDVGASNYVADEIDEINSDLDVAMIIYGALDTALNPDNTNLPAFYICTGTDDHLVPASGSQDLYDDAIAKNVPAELKMIEGAGHSFGVGTISLGTSAPLPETKEWPSLADIFMQKNLGHSTK